MDQEAQPQRPEILSEETQDNLAKDTITTPDIGLHRFASSVVDAVDPITEAIREKILKKQLDSLRKYLLEHYKSYAEDLQNEEKFKEFLSTLNSDAVKRELVDNAFSDPNLKDALEKIEISGYREVHETFRDRFRTMDWNDTPGGDGATRSQVVKNDNGEEICALNEVTHKNKPIEVTKSDGTPVSIGVYREIDFPTKFEKGNGSMHLSIVALKSDGTRPSVDKAVYFTAHYEQGKDGRPLLKEVSSPQPLKFAGDGDDAIAYIEHGGEIYTLAVTRGKYREMLQEVSKNKGHAVDLSPQQLAQDAVSTTRVSYTHDHQKEQQIDSNVSTNHPTNDHQKEQQIDSNVSKDSKSEDLNVSHTNHQTNHQTNRQNINSVEDIRDALQTNTVTQPDKKEILAQICKKYTTEKDLDKAKKNLDEQTLRLRRGEKTDLFNQIEQALKNEMEQNANDSSKNVKRSANLIEKKLYVEQKVAEQQKADRAHSKSQGPVLSR